MCEWINEQFSKVSELETVEKKANGWVRALQKQYLEFSKSYPSI